MDIIEHWWKTLVLALAALAIVLLVCRNLRKALGVAAGYGIYTLLGELYDTLLWPVIQGAYGVKGAVGMSVGALAINFLVLSVYQRQNVDWLGVGVVEALTARGTRTANRLLAHPTWAGTFLYLPARLLQGVVWALKTPWMGFLALSLLTDSFITTAFLRQGRFGSLSRKDILVFLGSSLLSCGFWVAWNAGVVTVFKQLWGLTI